MDQSERTLYVHRLLTNARDIADWARVQGLSDVLSPDDMHVTIAYSKVLLKWTEDDALKDELLIPAGERRIEKLGDGDVLVLRFESDALADR